VAVKQAPPASPTSASASASPATSAGATSASSTPLSLSAIQRLNTSVGFIAGSRGSGTVLAKTTDGGRSWSRLSLPLDYLVSLRFIDERVGWAAGVGDGRSAPANCQDPAPNQVATCTASVLRTVDGGQSWVKALSFPLNGGGANGVRQIQAVDGQRAWALTASPATCQDPCGLNLQRTTDGGRSWTIVLTGQIAAMRFASASRGWVALDNPGGIGTVEVRETSDGGGTWRTVLRSATGQAVGLDAATTQRAWVLTRNGGFCTSSNCQLYNLLRTDDGGQSWATLGNPKDSACSGGYLAEPLFASSGRGWLGLYLGAGGANVGPGGLLRSEDGGRTWSCATSPPNTSLLSAADPGHVWAAGEQDRATQAYALYASDNGGVTWRSIDLGPVP
jgi:photosystem II stability/assembly factor-like uncharacterized protein